MALLGAHISIAGGLHRAPGRGSDISADAIQVFTANQNQWHPRQPSADEAGQFRNAMGIERPAVCLSHDSYLINLGSPEEEKLHKSRQAFVEEIDRCEAAGISLIVFHPGSHMQSGETACLKTIAQSIDWCLSQRPDSTVTLCLENTAGQGTNVGYRFDHLASIIEQSKFSDRLGVCLDTQHAFAAGYDIRSKTGWREVINEFASVLSLKRIKAFHLNDSKKELGSRVDRHANIGRGYLTPDTFRFLVNDERFAEIPMVLETPAKSPDTYREELQFLRELIRN